MVTEQDVIAISDAMTYTVTAIARENAVTTAAKQAAVQTPPKPTIAT